MGPQFEFRLSFGGRQPMSITEVDDSGVIRCRRAKTAEKMLLPGLWRGGFD
jgi:hypothetical protein